MECQSGTKNPVSHTHSHVHAESLCNANFRLRCALFNYYQHNTHMLLSRYHSLRNMQLPCVSCLARPSLEKVDS